MKLKHFLITACLLLMVLPGVATANEEPVFYTVKKGDTLWDISKRFIKDPHYWPSLWSNNPEIGNPHIIQPGMKLKIYKGRIEVVTAHEEEMVEEEVPFEEEDLDFDSDLEMLPEELIVPEEVRTIPTYGGAQSYISSEKDTIGTLIDTIDNRSNITEGDTVFLEMDDLTSIFPGDMFELITLGPKVVHPTTSKNFGHQFSRPLGYQTIQLGTVEIIEITDTVAVATVTDALREILRGSKVHPYREVPERIPRIFADEVLDGYILSDDIGKLAMGQLEVILIDIGEDQGLKVGHELEIYRSRQSTEIAKAERRDAVILPDTILGDAVVMEVRHGFAEALIIETANKPIYRGDKVRTKTY
ncbi:MAG: LysM peptidoglycan-binding domain-containing protein [Desulfuromonadales bacterium]|nr:LysM peptidoglycan-binding domain-containing protein [Desulfuromonadales bacterium]